MKKDKKNTEEKEVNEEEKQDKPKKKINKFALWGSIITILILLLFVFLPLFYLAYMNQSEKEYRNIISTVRKSPVLNKKFGYIKEVKMNNFLKWTSEVNKKTCVKVMLITETDKHKACVIIKEDFKDTMEPYKVQGYIIGKEELKD